MFDIWAIVFPVHLLHCLHSQLANIDSVAVTRLGHPLRFDQTIRHHLVNKLRLLVCTDTASRAGAHLFIGPAARHPRHLEPQV